MNIHYDNQTKHTLKWWRTYTVQNPIFAKQPFINYLFIIVSDLLTMLSFESCLNNLPQWEYSWNTPVCVGNMSRYGGTDSVGVELVNALWHEL